MKANSVTYHQYFGLVDLGFKGTIPTVDEAIDFLRKKFNVVIYNKAAPFVDPITNSYIRYAFKVKFCDTKNGWNFRENIGESKWSKNIYSAKRQAITIAIKYAAKIKARKAKVIELRRASATGRGKSLTKKLEK